jgi:hypothetical protein
MADGEMETEIQSAQDDHKASVGAACVAYLTFLSQTRISSSALSKKTR